MMAPDYDKIVPDYDKKVPESEKVPESDKKYLKKAGGHIGWNVEQVTKNEDDSPNNPNNPNYQV